MKHIVATLVLVAFFVPATVFGQEEDVLIGAIEATETEIAEPTALELTANVLELLGETDIAEDGIVGFILRWRVNKNAEDLFEAVEKYEVLRAEQHGFFWEFRVEALERRSISQVKLFSEKVSLLHEYELISEENRDVLLSAAEELYNLLAGVESEEDRSEDDQPQAEEEEEIEEPESDE